MKKLKKKTKRNQTPMYKQHKSTEESFWQFTNKGTTDECWNWLGCKKKYSNGSYGILNRNKKQ